MMAGRAIPTDWTDNATLGAGGVAVPAEQYRQSIYVQAGAHALTITFGAVRGDTGASDTVALTVAAGGTFSSNNLGFMTTGAFTVTGTTGDTVVVLTQ